MSRNAPSRNGFTVVEVLFVLLIMSMLTGIFAFSSARRPQAFFARSLLRELESEQYQALFLRTKRSIRIEQDRLITEDRVQRFDSGNVCEPMTFSFNAKGSISKGGTLRCASQGSIFSIVMQLGTGRMRIESDSRSQ